GSTWRDTNRKSSDPRPQAECGTKMATRFHIVAIAAGLLLAVSGPSFAAKRMSDTRSAERYWQSH
ncbi:MAG: hypothetical protein WBD97_12390, partial [Pseudolabrys sp.]